ncbi:MAG: hypothetical protein IPP26_02080 [Flavobacteriales bacterium]|nr:hypothetical protein [Flavobacteriales bacterium]
MKNLSARRSLLLGMLLFSAAAMAQNNVAINNTGISPVPSALLDVSTNLTGAASKGLLIPRMVSTASVPVNATTDGMLVYQSGGTPGYYYYNASIPAWVRIQSGNDGWEVWGNTLAFPAQEWFGTTDNQDVVFRTNGVERMRLDATGDLGVGTATPTERLDVSGALRIFSHTSRAVTDGGVGFANQWSATDFVGVVTYQKDTIKDNNAVLANARYLMAPGHYGQTVNGSAINGVAATSNIGGWKKLENDYNEVFNAPYEFNTATCGGGAAVAEITSPPLPAIAANTTTALPVATQSLVSPYVHGPLAGQARMYRQQFMFLRSELDAELNQLYGVNGTPSPLATQGMCPGATITNLAFFINQATIAGTGAGGSQKTWSYSIIVKHAPGGLNNLSGGFDASIDPAAGCSSSASQNRPAVTGPPTWDQFNLITPFVWDGVRNIIVELAVSYTATASNPGPLAVKFATIPGAAPANQLTYTQWGNFPQGGAGCSLPGTTPCSATLFFAGQPSTGCNTGGGVGSASQRPVIRFGASSGFSTITPLPAVPLTGPYLQYAGGLVVEDPAAPPAGFANWGWQTTPYYAFKGPLNISAQKGVYDDGVRLNDHVFDRYFDGQVHPADAATFGQQRTLTIEEMAAHTQAQRHLPTIQGRADWQREGSFSLGEMANQLWSTTETQALYLTELNDKLDALEILSVQRPINASEFKTAKAAVTTMPELTEQEKAALMNDLGNRLSPAAEQH